MKEQPTNDAALRRARFLRANRATRPCRYCGRVCGTRGGLTTHERACVRQQPPIQQPQPNCEKCGGTGFVSFTRQVKIAGDTYFADFSGPCTCRK